MKSVGSFKKNTHTHNSEPGPVKSKDGKIVDPVMSLSVEYTSDGTLAQT